MKKQPRVLLLGRIVPCIVVLCGLAGMFAPPASAEPTDIVRIEEHWELSVSEPTVEKSSPQVSMVMSPTGDIAGSFYLFTLNYHIASGYIAGGMEVQEWYGDSKIDQHVGPKEGTIWNSGEVISWMQSMEIGSGKVIFQVENGNSTSWGTFGGEGYLKFQTTSALANLNGYRPAVSIGESEVGYAGNRVASLILKKLVWTTEDGTVNELNAPIDINTSLSP